MSEKRAETGGRTAIVAGATGLIGRELVGRLIEEREYGRVIALVRRPTGRAHPKLEERVTDYDRLETAAELFTGADLFCALGSTIKQAGSREQFRRVDLDYPLRLGELGKSHGVHSYQLVSAMGANVQSRIFYSRVKGEVEQRLIALELRALSIFRPSLLLGRREEFRAGERIAEAVVKPLAFLFAGPLGKYKPIEARTVASAMIAAALSGDTGVRVYESDQIEKLAAAGIRTDGGTGG